MRVGLYALSKGVDLSARWKPAAEQAARLTSGRDPSIQADAKGGQTADTDCKVLDIDEQGLRRGGNSTSSLTAGACWD